MKTLIIGASGFLGKFLYDHWELGEVYGTFFKNKNNKELLKLNLFEKRDIGNIIAKIKPDLVVHCGGLTNTDYCEENQEEAYKANVESVENLLKIYSGKIIYFSTDYVFDGTTPPYNENKIPNPLNYYGVTKLMAERIILGRENNLVVRVSGLYGLCEGFNRFMNKFNNENVLKEFDDLISTPTYINDILASFPIFLEKRGLLHFSGEESFSRYNFTKICVDLLCLNKKVEKKKYTSSELISKKPKDSSLISIYPLKKTPLRVALVNIKKHLPV